MSLVTVHGPNTMYTDNPGVVTSPGGQAKATVNANNGLIWTFEAVDKSRPSGDYTWAFPPDGTPSSPTGPGPQVITYGAAATKVGTLTVAGTNPSPPAIQNGSYPVTVKAVSGMPRSVEPEGQQVQVEELPPEEQADVEVAYDPGAHTVADVIAFAEDHPEQVQALLDAEQAGRNRTTLVSQLEEML